MADLQTIIRLTQDELKRQVPAEQAVLGVIERLKTREADVLKRRYGLTQKTPETLQEIGAQLGVTRERVRQIEAGALKNFREYLDRKPLKDLITLALELIRARGGVISQEVLYAEFLPASQRTVSGKRALDFLLQQSPELRLADAKAVVPFYALSRAHQQAVGQLIPIAAAALKQGAEPMGAEALLLQVVSSADANGIRYLLNDAMLRSTLELGKDFVETADGTHGLASWPEINPRNIRQKTRYVMKQTGTPLHFKAITEKIAAARFDKKKVTMQAVHNELINGDDFVLIGRGIYALKDWGYIPGTVSEVIHAILEKAGTALERDAIIAEVLKQRHVSRNTIMINLQEKAAFKRVDKHSYKLES